jgi:glycosyltransferase involved in cell wall biosynthesis
MTHDKIVLVTTAYDQADILADYVEWHLDLGVDLVIVQDGGSRDGSQEILDRLAKRRPVRWFVLPERNMLKYDSGLTLATMARDKHDAEWIILCDVDEFLSPEGRDLRTMLDDAKTKNLTVLNVPCFNMIGPRPRFGRRATQALTLRIDRPAVATDAQYVEGDLPVPYIFIKLPPKTIVRASAMVGYGPGMHSATNSWGHQGEVPGLRFLHYPIRGFDKLREKVRNTATWLEDNPHLEPWWGWHWRRWIRLDRDNRLREEYESQFVWGARARALIRDGVCTVDESVSGWTRRRWSRRLRGIARSLVGSSRTTERLAR